MMDADRAVVFSPAVRLLPGTVRPGEESSSTVGFTIYRLSSGEQTRQGRSTHRVEKLTRTTFDTPRGRISGYLVRLVHVMDLDLAEVTIELRCGFAPGDGVVYRAMTYTEEKLGLFGDTTRRTAKIAEAEGQ